MRGTGKIGLSGTIFIIISLTLFLGLSFAGDLEPSGPPGPSMHTLDEIYGLILYKQQGVPKTGQKTSFATGDDGDLEMGVSSPDPRFTDNGNGTVTDNLTGLMWTKDAQQISGTRDWYQAINECNGLSFANHDDWRLPNVRELHSLIDFANDPPLPLGHLFYNVQLSNYYWSSTTDRRGSGNLTAWYVGIFCGSVNTWGKDTNYFVWCVRGGL